MKLEPRDNLSSIRPYKHGKTREELLEELDVDNIIKLSSNENPLGASPKSKVAISQAIDSMKFYPEVAATELVRTISKKYDFPVDNIIAGAGATEIIVMLALAYLEEGDEVISAHPSFIMYGIAATFMKARYIKIPLKDYTFSLPDISKAVTRKTKMVFICNPNNPTGTIVKRDELEKFISDIPESTLIVLDEAYIDFVDDSEFPDGLDYVSSDKPVIVLRTFSKNYGLAGLRVGYGIGNREIITNLYRVKKPFNVTHLSQVAAIAALDDEQFLKRTVDLIHSEKEFMADEFQRLGIEFVPTQSNFYYLCFNSAEQMKEVYNSLQQNGILTRPMDSWGDPTAIRVTIGLHNENLRLIRVLEEVF